MYLSTCFEYMSEYIPLLSGEWFLFSETNDNLYDTWNVQSIDQPVTSRKTNS